MATKAQTGKAPVTLKTIADTAGVSVTTVARALKDGERISPETVRKVRETARELGYVRNMDGVKLRTGKTFIAMAFLSFSSEEEVGDSGSVGLLNGMHQRFAGTDYAVRAVPVELGETGLDKLRQVVRGRNCDGLILDHTEPQDARVKYLLEHDVPFVTFGRTELFTEHAYFDLDNEFAAYQGTKALIDEGYRRIALLEADQRYLFARQRLRGYIKALEEADIPVSEDLIRPVALKPDAAREAAGVLVAQGADSFVCVNELVFLGARAGVRLAAGEESEGFGYSMRSGTNLGDYIGTRVHVSYFSRLEAGRILASLLLKRIDGAPIDQCQKISQTTLKATRDG
ncbi:LacI family DNA-binding transcriptional regulator [Tropicimonas isoalkanivorans]|uniref:Transcriptional regulator, LacI family n=1 Tax=Tropicimonas isoalkanivorans TaxID=441112 RepID=A0A1I1RPV6_9RHOB|nr:LacI family DNA-binding transcriptional regulator [Tropicimonas isoalkanivorans]SFD36315.1 transcriptional regulator, LacI family [Tropicimonas isoalkanivorans]